MSDLLSQLGNQTLPISQCIAEHVMFLFNTRQGSLVHLPSYGLPDFSFEQSFQDEKKQLMVRLRELIQSYEPRMRELVIKEVRMERVDCILQVELTASLADSGDIFLSACLLSGGELHVMEKRVEQ